METAAKGRAASQHLKSRIQGRLLPALSLLGNAYVAVFVCRQALILMIQFAYVKVTQRVLENRASSEDQERLYRWLILAGANYRPLDAAAVPSYAVYLLIPLIFYFGPRLMSHHKPALFRFLVEPELIYARVAAKLDLAIQKVTESNQNYLHLGKAMAGAQGSFPRPESGPGEQDDSKQGLLARRRSIATFRRKPPNAKTGGGLLVSKIHGDHLVAARSRAALLAACRQNAYLRQLSRNKSPLWPLNRTEEWRCELTKHWLLTYKLFALFIFIGSQAATQVAQWLCTSQMQEELQYGSKLGLVRRPLRQMFLMDRLSMVEQVLFVWMACHHFVMPVSVMMATVRDQMRYLRALNARFERLFRRINQLEAQQVVVVASAAAADDFDCDRDALEIYLQFQYFISELGDSLKMLAFILSQYACFTAVLVFCGIAVANIIHPQHLYLLAMIITLTFVTTNCIFYFAAAFNAECIRCAKLAWTLIALSCPRGHVKPLPAASRELREEASIEHLVAPHTLQLWNRLICDHRQITDQFSCKVLGVFHMDYSNIIRFNFWLASVVMLVLTGSSQICHVRHN